MLGEPGIVRRARALVAEYRRTEGASPAIEELAVVRSQLRSLAVHPATSNELAERVLGVLLVVDVLVRSAPMADLEAIAG
jgi:hypothetical protein